MSRGTQVPCLEESFFSGRSWANAHPSLPHQLFSFRFISTNQSWVLTDRVAYLSTKLRVESWRWVWCDLWSKDAFSGGIQQNIFAQNNPFFRVEFCDGHQKWWLSNMVQWKWRLQADLSASKWRQPLACQLRNESCGLACQSKTFPNLLKSSKLQIKSSRPKLWGCCPARWPPTMISCGESLHKYPQMFADPSAEHFSNNSLHLVN